MILKDYHIHTTYSDGKNSPEEMILSAIEKGMTEIGFSDHSYTDFDLSYCMAEEKLSSYTDEIRLLAKKYKDRISVLCGIEQDYYSSQNTKPYDYVIGSVHYVEKDGKYFDVDHSKKQFVSDVNEFFGGSFEAFCRLYYKNVSDVVNKTGCDIIGHFDLVSKFNEAGDLFDETSSEYVSAWKEAADNLLITGKPFEINTGVISRGYKHSPYPSKPIYEYLKSKGAKFILSSDSHDENSIASFFEDYEDLLKI